MPFSYLLQSSRHCTVNPVLVVVLAISWTITLWVRGACRASSE
jgi:hypothetical protein